MVMKWNDLVHCVPIHCNYFVKVFGAQIEVKGSLAHYLPEYNTQQSNRNVFHKENLEKCTISFKEALLIYHIKSSYVNSDL